MHCISFQSLQNQSSLRMSVILTCRDEGYIDILLCIEAKSTGWTMKWYISIVRAAKHLECILHNRKKKKILFNQAQKLSNISKYIDNDANLLFDSFNRSKSMDDDIENAFSTSNISSPHLVYGEFKT